MRIVLPIKEHLLLKQTLTRLYNPQQVNGSSETFSDGVYMEEEDMDVSSDEYMSNVVSANEDDIMDTSDDNRPCSSTRLHSSVPQQRGKISIDFYRIL